MYIRLCVGEFENVLFALRLYDDEDEGSGKPPCLVVMSPDLYNIKIIRLLRTSVLFCLKGQELSHLCM